jgi:hypothetical protein
LVVVALETMEKGEKNMVRSMGSGGGKVNGCKLRCRDGTNGRMWGRTGEKDRKRREKVVRIIETVYDIILEGGDGCRVHDIVAVEG